MSIFGASSGFQNGVGVSSYFTTDNVGNSLPVDGLGPSIPFRCYQLWLQQKFCDDKASLRVGFLGLDTEFGVSETAGLFINATFGMPFLMVNNFPGGGPTYPMAAPAVRLALQPLPWLTVRMAISQANPFSPEMNQRNLASNFGPSGGLLSRNEVAASWHDGAEFTGLPGTAKAGFWIQSGPTSSDAGGSPFRLSFAIGCNLRNGVLYQRPHAFGRPPNQGERASRPFSFRLHGRDAHAPCPNQKSASKGTLVLRHV